MKLRTTLAALLLMAGTIVGSSVQAQTGMLDTSAISTMDLNTTVYTSAIARNTLGALMRELDKRQPGAAGDALVPVSTTKSEAASIAALSDRELESRIDALSTALTALASHGQTLKQQGQPLSPALAEVARRMSANMAVSTAEVRAALAGTSPVAATTDASSTIALSRQGASGEELCVAGQNVEFVHLNRRWPGTVKGRAYGGDQCLVTSNMNTGSFMQDLEISFADLREFAGAPEKGIPDVPGNRPSPSSQGAIRTPASASASGAMVATTPEEVLRIATRDHDAAIARYDQKRVRVTSLPGRIRISGNTMHLFADPSHYTASVVCLFEPDRMNELRSVPDDAAVTVEGDANIAGAERINIQNCHLVAIGSKPQAAAAPGHPPMGDYICMQSGQGIGNLTLAPSSYTASGRTGKYAYDAASGRVRFTSGNYAQWGWTGVWKTDAQSPFGVPEPRIDITDGGKLNIHCYPPK